MREALSYQKRLKSLRGRTGGRTRLPSHHWDTRCFHTQEISELVLVRGVGPSLPRHCVFARHKEIDPRGHPSADTSAELDLKDFPSVKSYLRLRCWFCNEPGFLQKLIEADGPKLSTILEQFIRDGFHLNRHGEKVWHFKRTKSFPEWAEWAGWSADLADWTRELMAHWDVGQDN